LELENSNPDEIVPVLLKDTFLRIDKELGLKRGLRSGCTAVVSLIREEDRVDNETNQTCRKVMLDLSQRVLYTANVGDARAVLW
jgi:serine/threonine protein phosphatase PrpC